MTPTPDMVPPPLAPPPTPPWLSGRRAAVQVIGFLLGMSLLAWCARNALHEGDFDKLRHADGSIVALLVGCTLVSVVANGAIFWTLVRSVAPVGFWHVQFVNAVVNLLNYAPVRLGLITRIAHHRRVHNLSYLLLVSWYVAVAALMGLTLVALMGATLLRPGVDLAWGALLVGFLVAGAGITVLVASRPAASALFRGAEQMLASPSRVTVCVVLRLIDTAAFAGRLAAAFALLGAPLPADAIVLLSIVSMITGLSPVGTLGFREWIVAFLTPFVVQNAALGPDVDLDSLRWQAVLIDRAAEAVVFLPLGLAASVWMVRQWRAASEDSPGPQ